MKFPRWTIAVPILAVAGLAFKLAASNDDAEADARYQTCLARVARGASGSVHDCQVQRELYRAQLADPTAPARPLPAHRV